MASTRRSADDVPSNIPPPPGGARIPTWATAYRQGFRDGADGKEANPPKDRDLAAAYRQGYAAGAVIAQEAEARARRAMHALGLSEEAKSWRRSAALAGPPPATTPVRVGRAKGAR